MAAAGLAFLLYGLRGQAPLLLTFVVANAVVTGLGHWGRVAHARLLSMQPRQRWTLGAFGLGGVLACYALGLPRQVAFVSMSVAFAAMLGATAFVVQRGRREQPSPPALAALVCHTVLAVSFALRAAMGLVVDESQLMPGSVSVAQLFTLVPGMVLIVVCSVCFLGMVHERHRAQSVRALAAHLQEQQFLVARRTAELLSANAALTERARTITQMPARLDSLQDEERRRMARELHDTLGQLLSAMAISLAAMRARLTDAAIAGHARAHRGPGRQLRHRVPSRPGHHRAAARAAVK